MTLLRLLMWCKSAIHINWKTTAFAAMTAAGYSVEMYLYREVPMPHWVLTAARALFWIGILCWGANCRDHNRSSEESLIK